MNSATTFIIFSCIFILLTLNKQVEGVRTDEVMPEIKIAQKICKTKSGVDDEVYRAAIERTEVDFDDHKLQCYAACLFEELSLIDNDNKIDFAAFIETLNDEIKPRLAKHLLKCQGEVENPDRCKKCMMIYQCMKRETGPRFYFV